MFFTKDIIVGPDGKPRFIGKDAPDRPQPKREPGAQMQCAVCGGMFDYLVGDDTPDGGVRGCEKCWKPGKERKVIQNERAEEIIG